MDVSATDPALRESLVELAHRGKERRHQWRALPQGDQGRFVRDTRGARAGTYVVLGGNRSGKTESGAFVFVRECLTTLAKMARTHGPITAWCVAQTYELSGEIQWKQKLRHLLHRRDIAGISWHDRGKEWPSMIRLKCGIEIVMKSADQGASRFQGVGVGMIWIDEQIPDDVLEEIQLRTIDLSAPIVITLTPIQPDPMMLARYEDPPKGWTFYEIDMEDNRESRGGYLPDEKMDLVLAELKERSPDLYETRKSGKFAAFVGTIFKTWKRSLHVISHEDMMRVIGRDDQPFIFDNGVDLGVTNPFSCLMGAFNPDINTWYVYDEVYGAETAIEIHARAIKERYAEFGIPEHRWGTLWADPGDSSATIKGEEFRVSGRRALGDCGFAVQNARKEWWLSCESVMKYLARPSMMMPDGEIKTDGPPRLFVSERCRHLIRQMPIYRFKQGTEIKDAPDAQPVKKDDHSVDALRYLIHSREYAASGGVGVVEGLERKFLAMEV